MSDLPEGCKPVGKNRCFEAALDAYWDCAYQEGHLGRSDGDKSAAILREIRQCLATTQPVHDVAAMQSRIAELERGSHAAALMATRLQGEKEELQARLAAAEKDAARYQFLKSCVDIANDHTYEDATGAVWQELYFEFQLYKSTDEAIDSAIAAGKE